MKRYPFTAVAGTDDLALALVLTTISPAVGGVLVRGEKGTAKSTIVRGLVEVLPAAAVVVGCRFSCSPGDPDPACPDGPHPKDAQWTKRPARLVELPVGATEDRVVGSLDVGRALSTGETGFQPGLLAAAHRGLLYVDEVNLLHDHLVDVLLDAAAMGRNSVERDGVSISHAARVVLVGTMNPEEGELRPQLLDRFGLTVEVAASRDPAERAEVVRRRLAFDADPEAFIAAYAESQRVLRTRIEDAREALPSVKLPDAMVTVIARICAGFEVDGMRADIVTARAAVAHAAWAGRGEVRRHDVRVAARLALPHRRRRNPFEAPGLDEELLEQLLGQDEPEPDPPRDEPPVEEDPGDDSDLGHGDAPAEPDRAADAQQQRREPQPATSSAEEAGSGEEHPAEADGTGDAGDEDPSAEDPGAGIAAAAGVAGLGTAYRTKTFRVRGVGSGAAGRRSRAITTWGHTIGAAPGTHGRLHIPATIVAAASQQGARGRTNGPIALRTSDLRTAVSSGHESNLVLLAVDASGSMAARRRMEEVKTAVLSLLLDAYQRRDRVGLVTFRGEAADLTVHPTSSVEAAAGQLGTLAHGGRTPLAEGLLLSARVLELERVRDPRRRALLVLVTDGRATAGPGALERARHVADRWHRTGVDAVVIDCESGRFRLGLAADLAERMGAEHVPLAHVGATELVAAISEARATQTARDARGRLVA